MAAPDYDSKFVYTTTDVARILTSLSKRAKDLEEVCLYLAKAGAHDDAAVAILEGLIEAIAAEGELTKTAFKHSPI